ncbi:LysR family transcriptional regulator [Pseudonocardiaceae bacterium YIM PH 21723]|nr:LysR family transcriptional regulator [Pseudonocardiaceae bacterium YIM PH 21723]
MRINAADLRLSQLRAYLAVAEYLHFSQAASALGVSQPTLSGAIAALEETLGTRLVERTTRRVMLTTAGERLVARARAVLDAVDALVDEAAAAGRPFSGTLRLGIIPTVAPYLLPVLLRGLRESYVDLEIEVHEEQTGSLLEGLNAGRLDVGLLALPTELRGLAEIPLYDEDFVLVTHDRHPMAGRETVAGVEFGDGPVLLLEEGHCLRDQALDICRETSARVGTATRAASLTTLVQLVAAGLGITLLPRTAVAVETTQTGLSVSRFVDPAPSRRIGLVFRESSGRSSEFSLVGKRLAEVIGESALPVRVPAIA